MSTLLPTSCPHDNPIRHKSPPASLEAPTGCVGGGSGGNNSPRHHTSDTIWNAFYGGDGGHAITFTKTTYYDYANRCQPFYAHPNDGEINNKHRCDRCNSKRQTVKKIMETHFINKQKRN